MLDHHFAERHPGHQHIYLGMADQEHRHEFQPFHSHNGLARLLLASERIPSNEGDGIVFVMPVSGAAHGVADITAPANAHSIRFEVAGGAGLVVHFPGSEAIPQGASVAPPTHPPSA